MTPLRWAIRAAAIAAARCQPHAEMLQLMHCPHCPVRPHMFALHFHELMGCKNVLTSASGVQGCVTVVVPHAAAALPPSSPAVCGVGSGCSLTTDHSPRNGFAGRSAARESSACRRGASRAIASLPDAPLPAARCCTGRHRTRRPSGRGPCPPWACPPPQPSSSGSSWAPPRLPAAAPRLSRSIPRRWRAASPASTRSEWRGGGRCVRLLRLVLHSLPVPTCTSPCCWQVPLRHGHIGAGHHLQGRRAAGLGHTRWVGDGKCRRLHCPGSASSVRLHPILC